MKQRHSATLPGAILAAALGASLAVAGLAGPALAQGLKGLGENDYPTVARADYVFGCMASNGQTREALERCSCSIDVISTILPYDRYVEAETVMRMQLVGGEKSVMFKSAPETKELVATLKRAQAESEIRCF